MKCIVWPDGKGVKICKIKSHSRATEFGSCNFQLTKTLSLMNQYPSTI